MLENVEARLNNLPIRLTAQRRTVLNIVLGLKDHVDADSLVDLARKKGISRATVYRVLPILVDAGILRKSFVRDGRDFYEINFGEKHHDHLVCTKCGRVIEFTDSNIETIQNEVCRKLNFSPVEHRLVIHGLCSECAKSKAS